jgi:Uma2 family endonuclease
VPLLVCDENIAEEMIAQRQLSGGDRFDEVWDGVYVMSPIANNEHQSLGSDLGAVIKSVVDWNRNGLTLVGANVSDREDDWTKNYRVPDVLVFKNGTSAIDRQSHWLGGPELAIEIVSKGDRTLEKLDFYASAGTLELLVIHRHPWQLSMFRRVSSSEMQLAFSSDEKNSQPIPSLTFPVFFYLNVGTSSIDIQDPYGNLIRAIAIQLNLAK